MTDSTNSVSQTPQSTFDEKLQVALLKFKSENENWVTRADNVTPPSSQKEVIMEEIVEEAKAAITSLVLEEVINYKKEIFLTSDLPSLLATDDYIRIREELREEQRSIITKDSK